MLVAFRFENFKSFRDSAIIDLTATRETEHPSHVRHSCGMGLLPLAVVYGSNASGKTSAIQALRLMRDYVVSSLSFTDEMADDRRRPQVRPFAFDGISAKKPSTFEVWFTDSSGGTEREYQYSFSLQGATVTEERLYSRARTAKNYLMVFRRQGMKVTTGRIRGSRLTPEQVSNLRDTLSPDVLVVSLGARLNIRVLKLVRDWFVNMRCIDFGDIVDEVVSSVRLPRGFATDAVVRQDVARFLGSFDTSIKDFEVEEVPRPEGTPVKSYRVLAIHEGPDGTRYRIDLKEESGGTVKMFELYQTFSDVFDKGGVMVVDELNAKLHPLIVRAILLSFASPKDNPRGAQLVCSAHDVWQMSNGPLRRDETWIADKALDGTSELYSLAEYEDEDGGRVRKDRNVMTGYLRGEFGGIPHLAPLVRAGEDDE